MRRSIFQGSSQKASVGSQWDWSLAQPLCRRRNHSHGDDGETMTHAQPLPTPPRVPQRHPTDHHSSWLTEKSPRPGCETRHFQARSARGPGGRSLKFAWSPPSQSRLEGEDGPAPGQRWGSADGRGPRRDGPHLVTVRPETWPLSLGSRAFLLRCRGAGTATAA